MMFMLKNILPIFTLLILFGACTKETIKENLHTEISAFHQIQLNSSFDVYLTEGNEYSITIVGDESVVDLVTFEVTDSLLIIDNERTWKWLKPTKNKIKIYITSPPLTNVTANQTCFIRTLTPITSTEFGLILKNKANNADLELNCSTFYYWNSHPCGGTVTLSGACNMLKLWNVALVNVQADSLYAQNAEVSNDSKGDCVINVSNKLMYTVLGDGNIEVLGNPIEIIESEPSVGSGQLIML
ncbi:MAG: hypothetical protein ACI8Q1_000371 [Parvicella sp.]|jgi:hypothetical protein